MTRDRHHALLDRDWADAWESLPEAPPLVPRPKTAQITLRIPTRLLARIKAVAAAKSLPYHALARAWLIEALRTSAIPVNSALADEPQAEQLNIKLDNDTLDDLKERADELRRPYHRLAREWIEAAVIREEESLGIDPRLAGRPSMKDLMVD
ncbi:MAG: CopG family antitoxin [Candidatus Dormibacteria bacterium]